MSSILEKAVVNASTGGYTTRYPNAGQSSDVAIGGSTGGSTTPGESKPLNQVETSAGSAVAAAPNFEATEGPDKTIKIDNLLDSIHSVVGKGDTVSGSLSCERGIRITGIVKGNVEARNGSVIVDEGGAVEGNVVASGRIICFGTIGQADDSKSAGTTIACPGIIVTAGKGKIYGNVFYGKLLTAGDTTESFIEGSLRPYAKFAKDKQTAAK